MRRLLLGLLLVSSAFAHSKDVVVTTDKFTGETTILLRMFHVGAATDQSYNLVHLSMGASYSMKGGEIILMVFSEAGQYQLLGGADVRALVDGERINLGHFQPSAATSLGSGQISEMVGGYLDRATMNKLANAKDVQLRVGAWEIELKGKQIEKLKEFAEAIPVAVSK
jgi:hypothetical protein